MLIEPRTMRFAAAMSSAVIVKGLLLYLGYLGGGWLDTRFGTHPFLMVGGLTVAAGVGIWWILYVSERYRP